MKMEGEREVERGRETGKYRERGRARERERGGERVQEKEVRKERGVIEDELESTEDTFVTYLSSAQVRIRGNSNCLIYDHCYLFNLPTSCSLYIAINNRVGIQSYSLTNSY